MGRFKGIYWRTFTVTVGMVALTLVLLGASFFALTYSYIMSEKRGELEDKAEIITQLAVSAYERPDVLQFWGGVSTDLAELLDVAQRMSDTNFLIWMPSLGGYISTDISINNTTFSLPKDITSRLSRGDRYAGTTDLGIYEKPRFVVAVPARTSETGIVVGPVLAIAEPNAMTEMWGAFMGIFGMTAITVLLIAFVATATTTMQQTKPIRDMAAAARRFAEGNFDARVHNTNREDEIGELIDAFNAMADSLQKTEQQRREFIANISHELKTPMTTIAGYADGILDGVISPEEERQYLSIISAESRRLSRLVRRMDVEVQIPEDPVIVLGDNDLLTQVVYNLLENAAKFADQGSALFLGLDQQGEKAVVTVRNTGETIPAEELPLLFERFHKADKSRSGDKDSVGLGLYIVRTILEQHREKITAASEDGITTFSFTVQLAEEKTKSVKE